MARDEKIRAILVAKNEDDVLLQVINHLNKFCEKIYVLDNGSIDKSVDILRQINSDSVVFLGTLDIPFFDTMRNWVWRLVKEDAKNGDWWLFADADEFFHDNVLDFLNRVPLHYGVVLKSQIYPIPVIEEREKFRKNLAFSTDFYTHYFQSKWVEPRFIRHTAALRIDPVRLTFSGARAIFPKAIRLIHYNWRTVGQICKRIETRTALRGLSNTDFSHVFERVWEDVIESDYAKNSLPFSKGAVWSESFYNLNTKSLSFRVKNGFRIILAKIGII